VFGLAATACSGGADASTTTEGRTTSDPETVAFTSPDGAVTVEVTAGGPEITIEPLPVTDLGLPDGFESFGAYELGPPAFEGGATVTVETGLTWGAGQLQLPIGLLGDGNGSWEVLDTATVSEVDGEVTVAFDVPHFSVLVVAGSPWGLDIDPWFVEAAVGERWDAYWDLVDPTLERIATTRPLRTYAVADDDIPVVGTVRALIEQAEVEATPRSGGAVSFDSFGEPSTGTFDYHLARGFDLRSPVSNQFVEVFYGTDVFACLAPGSGVYGFQVEVSVNRPDLLFAQLYGDGLLIARPTDGVVFRYAIAAPARCVERAGTIRARIVQHYLGFDQTQTRQVVEETTHDEDPAVGAIYSIGGIAAGLRLPRVDIAAYGGFRFEEDAQIGVDLRYNFSVFGCGGQPHASDLLPGIEVLTVCADDGAEVAVGGMILVIAEHADALPRAGAKEHYTYAVVFEVDGDPANDWEYREPSDWDFYQGTDRWYQLDWDPTDQTWSMSGSDALEPFGPSGARAVLAGNTIMWLVPASELDGDDPRYRVTAFAHDGSYVAEASGGDVSGLDPTLALIPLVDLEG
jgi:hypothetical protein